MHVRVQLYALAPQAPSSESSIRGRVKRHSRIHRRGVHWHISTKGPSSRPATPGAPSFALLADKFMTAVVHAIANLR